MDLDHCMRSIQKTIADLDASSQERCLDLLPRIADSIAQLHIVGQQGTQSGDVFVTYTEPLGMRGILLGQLPSSADRASQMRCPHCTKPITVTLQRGG